MLTLLGSLLGFFGGIVPDIFKIFRDRADRKHELAIVQLQMEREKQGQRDRVEEINIQADISESKALYTTWQSGVKWVDALNGTVRPVIAYAFFGLYAAIKLAQFSMITDTPWLLWSEEDQAIFAGIMCFYFGQRSMTKMRQGK